MTGRYIKYLTKHRHHGLVSILARSGDRALLHKEAAKLENCSVSILARSGDRALPGNLAMEIESGRVSILARSGDRALLS